MNLLPSTPPAPWMKACRKEQSPPSKMRVDLHRASIKQYIMKCENIQLFNTRRKKKKHTTFFVADFHSPSFFSFVSCITNTIHHCSLAFTAASYRKFQTQNRSSHRIATHKSIQNSDRKPFPPIFPPKTSKSRTRIQEN